MLDPSAYLKQSKKNGKDKKEDGDEDEEGDGEVGWLPM